MKMIQSFDPTAATSGSFDHKVSNPCGGVYLFNESNVWLQLRMPGGGYVGLPAWWSRFYRLDQVLEPIQWQELATISTVSSPLSQVYGEAYESSELKNRSFYDGPIPRNPYIANSVSSTVSTNQVTNDGNPATTTVVEATQSGNTGGSNLFMGNDGSFYFGQWVSSAYEKYLQGVPGATPYLELGAKAVLKWLDQSGANLSTILGITSGGNTFLQAHSTGNNIQLKDKNANSILEVLGNNTVIQGCDSSFNLNNILGVDGSGNTFAQAHPTGNQFNVYNKDGSNIATFDGPSQSLQITTTGVSLNGTTNGTVTIYEFLTGVHVKALLVYFNSYQNNSGTEQHLNLPVAFTTKAIVLTANCKPLTPYSGGSALTNNVRVLTTLASGGGSTNLQNNISGNSIGYFTGAFDGIGFGTNQASTATDIAFIIGF